MTTANEKQDPMEFIKSLWNTLGVPLPGMAIPTINSDELSRRITDLKAVEGWLKSNLSMLQMTIQGLEMQRATLSAFQAINQTGTEESQPNNPFANLVLWPWALRQPTVQTTEAKSETQASEPDKKTVKSRNKRDTR
jgi:hypothetical protein